MKRLKLEGTLTKARQRYALEAALLSMASDGRPSAGRLCSGTRERPGL